MIAQIQSPLTNWFPISYEDWPNHVKHIEALVAQPLGSNDTPGPVYKYLCWLYNEPLHCGNAHWKWKWTK